MLYHIYSGIKPKIEKKKKFVHQYGMESMHEHRLIPTPIFTAGGGGDPEAETGARLTCHLLLRLLQTKRDPESERDRHQICVRSTCDGHLLEAAHDNLTVGAVVAVLKVGFIQCLN